MQNHGSALPRRLAAVFLTPALGCALAAQAGAAVFRVGDDGIPPCTHATLAAAVAAAAANGPALDQIYLSRLWSAMSIATLIASGFER